MSRWSLQECGPQQSGSCVLLVWSQLSGASKQLSWAASSAERVWVSYSNSMLSVFVFKVTKQPLRIKGENCKTTFSCLYAEGGRVCKTIYGRTPKLKSKLHLLIWIWWEAEPGTSCYFEESTDWLRCPMTCTSHQPLNCCFQIVEQRLILNLWQMVTI